MNDIAAEIRDILVFHLGGEAAQLADGTRLAEDLGADSLDIVEVMMSCEERFDIDIPNHVAANLATVGEAVAYVSARVAASSAEASPRSMPAALPSFSLGQSLLRHFGFRKPAGI